MSGQITIKKLEVAPASWSITPPDVVMEGGDKNNESTTSSDLPDLQVCPKNLFGCTLRTIGSGVIADKTIQFSLKGTYLIQTVDSSPFKQTVFRFQSLILF